MKRNRSAGEAAPDAQGGRRRMEVAPPHPINTLMEEHKVILAKLKKLAEIASEIERRESFADFDDEMAELKDAVDHLIEAESHHKREEDTLFPLLERHGVTGPTRAMLAEHVELRKRKQELKDLLDEADGIDFAEFRRRLEEPSRFLASQLGNHISKEDNILYQMALQLLTDEEWAEVKKKCDEIGYCCFTPER